MRDVEDPVRQRHELDGAATYEIVVEGAGLASVETAFPGSPTEVSGDQMILRFEVRDQAALFLVLDRIFGRGLKLSELRRIEARPCVI